VSVGVVATQTEAGMSFVTMLSERTERMLHPISAESVRSSSSSKSPNCFL
jgi:hypothetical protein